MAYKFQLGSAILSGSTKFEELVEAAGGFKPTVADTAATVADDSFYFQDADGAMKRESMADYATAIAGDGLAASSGVLAVGVDDTGIELNSDALRLKDNGVTLAKMAGIARGSIISGDASGDPQALSVGSAHQFLQSDGTDLAYVSMSGDATLAAGVLSIGATKVTDAMMNDDVATGLAGNGLSAASGVVAIDLNELSAAAIDVANDSFALIDANDSNGSRKESFADYATAIAGIGLKADAGVLEVRVTGSVIRSGDKIGISGSIAGDGLKYLGSINSVTALEVDLNEMGAGAVAVGADHFVFVDADDSVTKKESFADLATAMAGDGLAAASGVLAIGVDDAGIELNSDALRLKDNGVTLAKMAGIARGSIISGDASGDPQALSVGSAHQFLQSDGTDLAYVSMSGDATLAAGVLSIGATKVTDAMMNDDVATGLAGVGLSAASGVLALDSSELSDAAVASGDKFVFQDATDDSTKKESIDDIATFMAGPGLSAASGVLSARLDVAAKADGGTLATGLNYFADLSSNATVTLPASPAIGDTVVAKAKGLSSAVIIINKAGSQTIDGETSVTIESPYGAVSMVYVASNDWRLV